MKKYLKRYNEETHEWEIISPDISVTQVLSGNTPITDTNVVVTNYQYAKEKDTTLDDALGTIGDDISLLKRNVSWLAEHGGGGSGGGGGTMQSYGIVLISPVLKNGAIYTSSDALTIKFMITGGTEGDICKYSCTYDNISSGYSEVTVGKEISINIDNSKSSESSHVFEIHAINPYNNTINPLSFPIYISKFSVINDTSIDIPGSIQYIQGIYNVSKNYKKAYIPMKIQCGLLNATVTITATWNDNVKSFSFTSQTTEIQTQNIPLWDIIGEDAQVNNLYIIDFSAQAVFSDMPAIDADNFRITTKIINPSELTITTSVNAQSAAEQISVPYNDIMSYTFTFLGPSIISTLKYAMKIKNGTNEFLINGSKYYSDDLKEEGCTYMDNESTNLGATVSKNYIIGADFNIGDEPVLYIKGWSYNGAYSAETEVSLKVINASTNIFPRQINEGTLFASWNKDYTITDRNKWVSIIKDYDYLYHEYTGDCVNTLSLYDGNDSSGMQTDSSGVTTLRIQNHAYAKIDLSKYSKEIEFLSGAISRAENIGFSISITLFSDASNYNNTLFLWGSNNIDGTLSEGLKIANGKAYWYIYDKLGGYANLVANIPNNVKTTIDFVYDGTRKECLIYVNGEPNAAKDFTDKGGISTTHFLPNNIYLGCDYYNSQYSNFSDMNVYDFSITTSRLNDLQINVNSKNARLNGLSSNPDIIADYNAWKKKNFIYVNEGQESVPLCYLFNNGDYIEEYNTDTVRYIYSNSNIPTILLNFNSEFTEDIFFNPADEAAAKKHYACNIVYYAPSENGTGKSCEFPGEVSLQGTSTLRYRIKNLEIYTTKFTEGTVEKPYLFQPINKWFPESEFTLKADVVDSAHANNSVIGEWINNANILSNTPPMNQYAGHEPKDITVNGEIIKTPDPETGVETDYHKEVSIRHNLEGFPVLLFISFPNKSTYQLIGIYSFNLGRYSYYNMGMRFLKNFCRRDENDNLVSCPCIISKYEESDTLGNINTSDVYSFEFGNNKIGAGSTEEVSIPLWTQYDKGILAKMGEFKYPETVSDSIWEKLKNVFLHVAQSPVGHYVDKNAMAYDGYEHMLQYYVNSEGIVVTDGSEMPQSTDNYYYIPNELAISNFYGYYVIANAFGLTDSLGKNMVLRTWNGGDTWWPCFYDMDTALGLQNTGAENIPVNCYMDTFICSSNTLTQTTSTGITYHDINSDYAAGDAKIWGLLRDELYHYETSSEGHLYEKIWGQLRASNGKLSTHEAFINEMKNKVNTCGELIYCEDYYSKYIRKGEGTDPSIAFLHGNRIEYVNDWLKKHFYYLDGMLDTKKYWASIYSFASSDTPLYNDNFTWAFYYTAGSKIPLTFRPVTPTFITIDTNTQNAEKFYLNDTNKDFTIYYANNTASNTQTTIYGTTLLTNFIGMNSSGFKHIMPASKTGALSLLRQINISNNLTLDDQNPLNDLSVFKKNSQSYVEVIDFSNLKFNDNYEGEKTFPVDLHEFTKLLRLNIENSDVNSLTLPSSSLQYLNIKNSNIVGLTLNNQNIISELNFEGCNNLKNVSLDNCNAISNITVSNKQNIDTISVYNCSGITSIDIENNPSLANISIANNISLEEIVIKNCTNKNLTIEISRCPLKKITINGVESTNIIKLPERELLSGATLLDLTNCYNIDCLQYGEEEIGTYVDIDDIEHNILDLSPFININEENVKIKNLTKLACLRVNNIESKPFNIVEGFISNNKELVRIFGHICLKTAGAFGGLTKFYLNEPVEQIGGITPFEEPVFVSDDTGYTNVSVDTDDVSLTFTKTRCTLSDVYYFLQKCDGVLNLGGLFSACANVIATDEDRLNEYTFSHCSAATSIDSIFDGCNISGYLHKNLLSGMTNLESFDFVFGANNDNITIDRLDTDHFFPFGSKIKSIIGFNPKHSNGTGFYDKCLLTGLTELEVIRRSFCNCDIDFWRPGYLFESNTKLKEITDSFLNVAGDTDGNDGPITNVFGATSIETIEHSFTFISHGYFTEFKIGNSFFNNVKDTLKKITGDCFSGNGCKKYIDYEDCNGECFPYDIFKECTKLEEIEGFFDGIKRYDEDPNKDEIAKLPFNGMFDNCTALTNISRLFSNMNIKYSLAPDGFTNCQITNVSSLFANSNNRYGYIPYHFLYQEKGNIINDMSFCFEGSGANMSYYECSDEVLNEYLYEDSDNSEFQYKWNIYIFDGNANFYQRIANKISEIEVESGITEVTRYKYSIGNVYYYVDNIEDVPVGIDYEEVICYKQNDDFIFPELPPQFKDGYVNKWEIGTIKPGDLIGTDSEIKDSVVVNDDTLAKFATVTNYFCPPDIFKYCNNNSKLNIKYVFNASSELTRDGDINGMYGKVPPFFLNYLNNVTDLTGLFNNCSALIPDKLGRSQGTEEYLGNLYPIDLFSGLTNVTAINYMFAGNIMWGKCQINADLFNPFAEKIINANSLFNYAKWINNLNNNSYQLLPQTFIGFHNIENINNMFYRSTVHINSSLFSSLNNPLLRDVSSFMNYSGGYGTVPTFWTGWSYIENHSKCYSDIDGSHIDNYGDIPESYKS